MPNIIQRIKNFTIALYTHITSGSPKVSTDEHQRRKDICNSCKFQTPQGICNLCGCDTDTKSKWGDQDCPRDFWDNPKKRPLKMYKRE